MNIHFFPGQRHETSARYVCFSPEVKFTLITVLGGGNANSWHLFHKSQLISIYGFQNKFFEHTNVDCAMRNFMQYCS